MALHLQRWDILNTPFPPTAEVGWKDKWLMQDGGGNYL